jgi:hypothetical protein
MTSEVTVERAWSVVGAPPDRWDLSTRTIDSADEFLTVQPGRIVELSGPAGLGLTRLGYRLLADRSHSAPVVMLDVRGWISPQAAWETGVEQANLVVIRCPDSRLWPQVVSAVCEGVSALFAEVPQGVSERDLRRLAALVRARQVRVVLRPLRGRLSAGVSHLRVQALEIQWNGVERGHGRLGERRLVMEISGKGAAGMTRRIELEDVGENALRVVSGMAARTTGRAV